MRFIPPTSKMEGDGGSCGGGRWLDGNTGGSRLQQMPVGASGAAQNRTNRGSRGGRQRTAATAGRRRAWAAAAAIPGGASGRRQGSGAGGRWWREKAKAREGGASRQAERQGKQREGFGFNFFLG